MPVDGLTHVNFAFAYIDPGSFEITPMDSLTPASLCKLFTSEAVIGAKSRRADRSK